MATIVVDIFGAWLFCLTMILFLTPLDACYQWYKNKSSDAVPSVGMVVGLSLMFLWLCYGLIKGDPGAVLVNAIGLTLNSGYMICYAYFLRDKKYLVYQLATVVTLLAAFCAYISTLPQEQALLATGRVCTTVQSWGFCMGFYGIYNIMKIKTTEYMPFKMTAYGAFVCFNALIFSFLIQDIYMITSTVSGAVMTAISFSMYFIYPPKTWSLPWQKKEMKEKST